MRELFDELKYIHNNAVLLFKLGDEYHAYYEDAELICRHCCDFKRISGRVSLSECDIELLTERMELMEYKIQILTEADR